jgi:hypothetical protein
VRAWVLWSAAVLGALFGALVAEPFARACECSPPSWTLRLSAASDANPEASAWPVAAILEARPGTVIIWSQDMSGETVDYIHAGDP